MTRTTRSSGNSNLVRVRPQRRQAPGSVGKGSPGTTHRRRRWWLWIAVIIAAIAVIIAGAVAAFVKLAPTARPLTLPAGAPQSPAGAVNGAWRVSAGSKAGFLVQEEALGLSNYVGGTTGAVTGTIVVSGDSVTAATIHVNLAAIRVNGKPQPQVTTSLGTRAHPIATFTLSKPVPLGRAFTAGRTVTIAANGQLSMNGSAHAATVKLTARRSGSELQAAGSIPVTFAIWHITQPTGFGFLGALADHGTADFVIILHRT